MDNMKINTALVKDTAERIRKCNKQIKNGMDNVQKAVYNLNNFWESPSSGKVINKFNNIKNSYSNTRYQVMDNYVAFLYKQIGENYEIMEANNTSLADALK